MADLEWVFQVVDKATGPLRHIDEKMRAMPNDLEKVEDAFKKVDQAIKLQNLAKIKDPLKQTQALLAMQRDKLKELGGAAKTHAVPASEILESFGLGFIAKGATLVGAIDLVVGGLKALGSMAVAGVAGLFKLGLEASESKRSMLGMLDVFEEGRTNKVFGTLQDMGIAAGISADNTVKAFAKLRGAGFGSKNSQDIIAASFDVAAARGGGEDGLKSAEKFTEIMTKLRATSKFEAGDLNELSKLGISTDLLTNAMAKRLHKTSKDARKLIADGKADAVLIQNAMLDVVQSKVNAGGALGTKAKELAGGSVNAQLQALKDRFGNLFEDVNIQPFARALARVGELLGGDLGNKIKSLAESFFKLFDTGGFLDLERILRGIVDISGAVYEGFNKAFSSEKLSSFFASLDAVDKKMGLATSSDKLEGWKTFGTILGTVVGVMGVMVGLGVKMVEVFTTLASLPQEALNRVLDAGKGIADGFKAGIKSGDPNGAVREMAQGGIAGIKQEYDMHSPSRVMKRLGSYAREGWDLGLEDGEPNPIAAIGANPSNQPLGLSAAVGGKQIAMQMGDIIIHSSAGGDASAMAREVRAAVQDEWLQMLERVSEA